MMFQERVISSAPRHSQLLLSLDETAHAAAAVEQTEAYISKLQIQIAIETKNVEKLHWRVSRERSEYEMELEYSGVLEAQAKAEQNLEAMKSYLEEAQLKLPTLRETAILHTTLQTELTILYDTIFSPPHPPFLTLEIAQSLLARAQASHTAASKPFETASQTVQLLTDANKYLGQALSSVTNALDAWRRDPVLMRNNFSTSSDAQSIERNAMAQAQSEAREAEICIARARRLEPGMIGRIGSILIAQTEFLVSCGAAAVSGSKPVAFNAFRFKEKMDVAERDLRRAVAEVAGWLGGAKGRVGGLKGEVDECCERLRDAKVGVRRAREEIFGRVVKGEDLGEGGDGGAGFWGEMRSLELPSYVL